MDQETALVWISDNREQIIEASQKIWEYAELGLVEFKSSKVIADMLEEHGFKVKRGVADMPTAFAAIYGETGPTIGIMGEYDALPGLSQKASTKPEALAEGAPGHGCGHNIHGVSGMAAAIAVRMALEKYDLPGIIKFFGCPAEETYSGKVFMVREGLFDDVDAALSHHPGWFNYAGLASSLAVNSAKFHFHGVSSHAAASPEMGRSALDAVELMNAGVNFMREHILQEARIHYVIEKGGDQPNVVPSYARTWYYIRAPERNQLEQIYEWVLRIADGADLMARTTHDVEFLEGMYNVLPNRALSELVTENMRSIGVPEYTKAELAFAKKLSETVAPQDKAAQLKQTKRPQWKQLMDVTMDRTIPDAWDEGEVMPGSTDVADVSWLTPTMEFGTSTCPIGIPFHSWQTVAVSGMSIGHKSLIFAAQTMALTALDMLTKPDVLNTIRKEFAERKAGQEYKSPVPQHIKPPLDVAKEAAGIG